MLKVLAILFTATIALIFYYIKVYRFKKIVCAVLESSGMITSKTSIAINPFTQNIRVGEYKPVTQDKLESAITTLQEETHRYYFYERKGLVLKLSQLKEISKPGLWLQNVKNGKTEQVNIEKMLKKQGGIVIAAASGSGKSVLVRKIIKEIKGKNSAATILFYSPKGGEDIDANPEEKIFVDWYGEKMISETMKIIDGARDLREDTYIVFDELLSMRTGEYKALNQAVSRALSLVRSTKLKFILCTQRLNKTADGVDLSLCDCIVFNIRDIANFTSSLGMSVQYNTNLLKSGEFLMLVNGAEYKLINRLAETEIVELEDRKARLASSNCGDEKKVETMSRKEERREKGKAKRGESSAPTEKHKGC